MNEDNINPRFLPPSPQGWARKRKDFKVPIGGLGIKNKGKKEEYRIES